MGDLPKCAPRRGGLRETNPDLDTMKDPGLLAEKHCEKKEVKKKKAKKVDD